MVNKKKPAEKWPVLSGDYALGDPESAVAVITLGSHMDDVPVKAGSAISGSLHTENLGIEKVVTKIVSNLNIRFLVVCGAEVQGHNTGNSIKTLRENGVDPTDEMRVIGAEGAVTYLENVTEEGVRRFQDQVEIVDLMDVEDPDVIQSKIEECLISDTGLRRRKVIQAYEEETVIIPLREKETLIGQPEIHKYQKD